MNIKLVVLGTSVVSAAIGAAAGYFYARKELEARLNEEYDERLEAEIERTKHHYQTLYKVGEDNSDPVAVLSRRTPKRPKEFENETDEEIEAKANTGAKDFVKEIIGAKRYGPPDIVVDPAIPALKTTNVFSHTEPTPGKPDSNDAPYVLTVEEFHQGLLGHDVTSLTLYSDQMLVNEREEPMDDVARVIGLENLTKFGVDPNGDANTIYIRNSRIGIDFEIVRSEMTYAEVVGFNSDDGIEPNVKAANKKASRRR